MFSFEAVVWLKLIEHTPLNTKMHISARTQFFRELAIDSKFDMDRLIMIPIYQNKRALRALGRSPEYKSTLSFTPEPTFK